MTLVAPVARTVFTRVWMPATWYDTPEHDPPSGRHAVDGQPAALVQGDAHGVDLPALHRLDRGCVVGPIGEPPALNAGVFGAHVVHAVQRHVLAKRVDELVSLHGQR